MFARSATSLGVSPHRLCEAQHCLPKATSFCVRLLKTMFSLRSKWCWPQAVKRCCILTDTNTKNKALLRKCFFFCVCVRQDTTSFDRLRSTSFRVKREHRSALADTKWCYTLRCKRGCLRQTVPSFAQTMWAYTQRCCASCKHTCPSAALML